MVHTTTIGLKTSTGVGRTVLGNDLLRQEDVCPRLADTGLQTAGHFLRRRAGLAFGSATLVILLMGALAAGSSVARGNASAASSAVSAPLTVRVTVAPGQSLWSLARQYGNPNDYIEDRVDALAKANGVRANASLIAGQRLLVPVSNPVEIARLQTHVAFAR